VDDQIKRLFEFLKKNELYEDSLIVLTADHGEGLGQHKWYAHGKIYNEQINIPLIIKLPKDMRKKKEKVSKLASIMDILPTVMTVLDLPVSEKDKEQLEGINLLNNTEKREYVFVERTHRKVKWKPGWKPGLKYALLNSRWKYHYYAEEDDEFYNLRNDYIETKNLIKKKHGVADGFRKEIEKEIVEHQKKNRRLKKEVVVDPEVVQQLEALGYTTESEEDEDNTESGYLSHGPLAGAVTSQSALLWVRTVVPAMVDFAYSDNPDMENAEISSGKRTEQDRDLTLMTPIEGLQPDTRYYYTPRVNGKVVFKGGFPSFRTAPKEGVNKPFSFIVLTDFQNAYEAKPVSTFKSAAESAPVFAFIGGDLDHRNPGKRRSPVRNQIRRMYRENFDRRLKGRKDFVDYVLRRFGIVHQWDDHDFCCNDSDGTYAEKEVVLQTYDEYFPSYQRPFPLKGIYQTWKWGNVQFFSLDCRYNRSPSKQKDDRKKTMLGAVQKRWLMNGLRRSKATWKIIFSSSVFNPTVKCGADNWCEYRTEGREISRFIRNHGIRNVVFITGDIHAGAITNGKNSVYNTFWEMAVPGADATNPGCDTTTYQGMDKFGEWTHGTWGKGFRKKKKHCRGFGQVDVLTSPDRLRLSVKDQHGKNKVSVVVPSERD